MLATVMQQSTHSLLLGRTTEHGWDARSGAFQVLHLPTRGLPPRARRTRISAEQALFVLVLAVHGALVLGLLFLAR